MTMGFSCKPGTSNGHYRVLFPMAEMRRRGHKVMAPADVDYSQALKGVPNWDLLHIHQAASDEDLALVQRLRAGGVAVVWDSDDDIRNVPRNADSRREIGGRWAIRRYHQRAMKIAREAHLVTTTSPYLAEAFRSEGIEHVVAIPNYLKVGELPRARRKHRGIVIGIVAAREHVVDIAGLRMADVLKRVLAKHQDASVVSIGCDLRLPERYVYNIRVPFGDLLRWEQSFDIGLAPLVDSPFSRARSDIKLKEYAVAGVPWLASPVGPYAAMEGPAQGGRLVADDEWLDALDELVGDVHLRVSMAAQARVWAKTQTVQQKGSAWETAFADAVRRAKRQGEARSSRSVS